MDRGTVACFRAERLGDQKIEHLTAAIFGAVSSVAFVSVNRSLKRFARSAIDFRPGTAHRRGILYHSHHPYHSTPSHNDSVPCCYLGGYFREVSRLNTSRRKKNVILLHRTHCS